MFQSDHGVLLRRTASAFEGAVNDVIGDAADRAPKRTGRFGRSISHSAIEQTSTGLRTTVGSPLSSARVKEMGGFMQSKSGDRMRFQINGQWVTATGFRVAAQPTVGPAARNFARYMGDRLRALGGSGAGWADFSGAKADFRSGIVR